MSYSVSVSVDALTAAGAALRAASAVCLDVDSTVCTDEGIDKLAAACGVGEEVAAWTARAMGGGISFQESFKARLDIIKPTLSQVDALAKRAPELTPGAIEFVNALKERGTAVFLITGGIRPLIEPVADALGLPYDNIYSNVLRHAEDGSYVDFDHEQLTSRTGGKPAVVQLLKDQFGHQRVVMIGDGVTDMEARPPADYFIGFGGNVQRDKVKAGCDYFAAGFDELRRAIAE